MKWFPLELREIYHLVQKDFFFSGKGFLIRNTIDFLAGIRQVSNGWTYETNTVGSATPALGSILTPNHCSKSIPRITSGSIRVGTMRKDTVVVASFHSSGSLAILPSTKIGVFCTPITCVWSCIKYPISM